jgi:acyl-CoA thioesterase-1
LPLRQALVSFRAVSMARVIPPFVLCVAAALTACAADKGTSGQADARKRGRVGERTDPTGRAAPGAVAGGRPRAPDAADERPVVLFLGTSLTAGLGLDPDEAYPARVQEKVDSAGLPWRVVNGGVSGETSAGALRRLEWILGPSVKVLVVETGANDGLRGLDVDSTRANLEAIVARARAAVPGVRIIVASMEAPPNLGATYTARFRAIFRDVARRQRLVLVPFILDGVGGVDSLNQGDGIHPNVVGARLVAANVWRVLEPVLRAEGTGGRR